LGKSYITYRTFKVLLRAERKSTRAHATRGILVEAKREIRTRCITIPEVIFEDKPLSKRCTELPAMLVGRRLGGGPGELDVGRASDRIS
jgi:hypothetical protein